MPLHFEGLSNKVQLLMVPKAGFKPIHQMAKNFENFTFQGWALNPGQAGTC